MSCSNCTCDDCQEDREQEFYEEEESEPEQEFYEEEESEPLPPPPPLPPRKSNKAINDYTCTACGNPACSKTEKSCWKCGEPIKG